MALNKTLVGIFGLVFTVLAFICMLIAFATPNWIESFQDRERQFIKMGLWEACFDNWTYYKDYLGKRYKGCWWIFSFEYRPILNYLNPSWFRAIQIILTLTFLGQMAAIMTALFYFLRCCPMPKSKIMVLISTIINFGSGLLIAASCVTFGVQAEVDRQWLDKPDSNYLSWSFGFCVLSGFFSLFAGMCLLVEYLRLKMEDTHRRKEEVYGLRQPRGHY